MNRIFILFFALFLTSEVKAQIKQPCSTCLPEGILFSSQATIDNFQVNYPNCTEIEGVVTINGEDISNLNGLNVVTYIGGDFYILFNDVLTSLTGLDGLTSIGGDLQFFQNAALTNLTGLDNTTFIGGNLLIGNDNSALTSLTGLEGLTSIGGDLKIYSNAALTNLTGLDGLSSIGGDLYISSNFSLTSLTGLDGLTSIAGYLDISYNDSLTSLTGLDNIDAGSITNLYIIDNNSLSTCETQCLCDYVSNPSGIINIYGNAVGCNSVIELANACGGSIPCLQYGDYYFVSQADIDNFQTAFPNCTALQGNVIINGSDITNLTGLENLTSIGGYLRIYSNDALTSLTGLDNLTSIGGYLSIYNNTALTSLIGLEGLTSVGGMFFIGENFALTSLTGLDYLTSIGDNLTISNSNALTNLTGLDNMTFIGGYLKISDNDALTSLTGLDNLTSIGDFLYIDGNDALTNLAGLDNVTSIAGYLRIEDNGTLTSLTGLDNIEAGSIQFIQIFYNNSLSNCDVQSICDYLAAPNGFIQIYYNATGCDSQQEVEDACFSGVEETTIGSNHLNIYPNPASTQINVRLTETTTPQKNTSLTIIDITGKEVLKCELTQEQTVYNVSGLSQGVYFVRVADDRTVQVQKFIKQ